MGNSSDFRDRRLVIHGDRLHDALRINGGDGVVIVWLFVFGGGGGLEFYGMDRQSVFLCQSMEMESSSDHDGSACRSGHSGDSQTWAMMRYRASSIDKKQQSLSLPF